MEFTVCSRVSYSKRKLLPLQLKVSAIELSGVFSRGGWAVELCPLSPRVEMKCYPTTSAANSTSAISQLSPAPRPSARSLWAAQPGLEGPGRARTARGHRTAAVPGPQGKGNASAVRFRLQNGSLLQLRCNTKRVKATQLMCKVEAPQYLMQNGAGNPHF